MLSIMSGEWEFTLREDDPGVRATKATNITNNLHSGIASFEESGLFHTKTL
jgi:hypothetical protein